MLYMYRNGSLLSAVQGDIVNVVVPYPDIQLLYVIENTNSAEFKIRCYNQSLVLLSSVAISMLPVAAIDAVLFDIRASTAFNITSELFTDIFNVQYRELGLWTANNGYLVAINIEPYKEILSDQIDIYNFQTGTWVNSTQYNMLPKNGYSQAFEINGVLALMTEHGVSYYNITSDSWFLSVSTNRVDLPVSTIGPLTLQLNDTAFVTLNSIALRIFQHNGSQITKISDSSPIQLLYDARGNQIIVSANSSSLYFWKFADDQWDAFLFPRANNNNFMMTISGNFLLVSSESVITSFDYCYLPTKGWSFVPNIANYNRPAAMSTFKSNGTELIVMAGGTDRVFNFFTDSVKLLDISSLVALPPPATDPVASPIIAPEQLVVADMTTLIVAIVVPVGAVLIAGGLLAFFMVRRNKNKKNQQMSVIGLESNYGQWFIPFNELIFGEQLGHGASGQVFKGTWNNTSVALKLSMTQANNSVISELSLMIQLRPHPNIVQLLGFSVHPETESIILVLEYCNQGALDSVLFDSNQSIQTNQKIEWLVGISKGLSHLHSNNIIHRDVAARNILLHQNEAKLTDFGMSRLVSENQRGTTKSELGPIRWMAPESLKNKEYSSKSGMY